MTEQAIFNFYPTSNQPIGIVSIPHSGEIIPEEFKEFLTDDLRALAQDVDYKVDELVNIEQLNKAGISVLVSRIHRTCVDLNRPKDKCVLNWKSNSLGVQLVNAEPSDEQREVLEQKYWAPYYEMLHTVITKLHKEISNKNISIIDLHSMPSRPTEYHLKITPNQPLKRPQFCVSDIEGLSCEKSYIDFTCEQLSKFSSDVTQNIPYFGGHITRYIDAKYERKNNIQIEINREIYMDETEKVLVPELSDDLKPKLTSALIEIFNQFS